MDKLPKPLSLWSLLGSVAAGLIMWLLPRTPPYIIASLVVIFVLLFHPIWYFWWIEETLYRRLSALTLIILGLCLLGYSVWPTTERSADKPYFGLLGTEVKTTPSPQLIFQVKNMGNHTAINLFNRLIMVDQQFQIEPTVFDWSEGNELPSGLPRSFTANLHFPSAASIEVPAYVIFAIRYQDKESSLTTPLCQIWYLKWAGTVNGTLSPDFPDASIMERSNILSHLGNKLKDYLK